jgi:hypothetical protein
VHTTKVRTKDNPVFGPVDGRVVELEPGHAENDWVVTKSRDVKLDVFGVRADFKANWKSLVGDGAGGDGTPIDNLEISRRIFGLEADGVGLGEGNVDEGRGSAGVDHRERRNRDILNLEGDRENDVFLGVEVGNVGSVNQKPVGQCGIAVTVTATRVRRIAQR